MNEWMNAQLYYCTIAPVHCTIVCVHAYVPSTALFYHCRQKWRSMLHGRFVFYRQVASRRRVPYCILGKIREFVWTSCAASSTTSTATATKDPSSKWSCPLCSHRNNDKVSKCEMCLSDKFLVDETSLLGSPVHVPPPWDYSNKWCRYFRFRHQSTKVVTRCPSNHS